MFEILQKLGMVEDEVKEIPTNVTDIIAFVEDLVLYNDQEFVEKFLVAIFSEAE